MAAEKKQTNHTELDPTGHLWERIFTVSPLVLIGTKEGDGYDVAPKHMAMPIGLGPYFVFICTPSHNTYINVQREKSFTVSFPKPDQVVLSSLTASPRCEDEQHKSILDYLNFIYGEKVDAPILKDAYLYLECTLDRIIEGFGNFGMVCGKIVAAGADPDYVKQSGLDENEQIYNHPYLAYLAHGRWAQIKETFAFPYPKDFKK